MKKLIALLIFFFVVSAGQLFAQQVKTTKKTMDITLQNPSMTTNEIITLHEQVREELDLLKVMRQSDNLQTRIDVLLGNIEDLVNHNSTEIESLKIMDYFEGLSSMDDKGLLNKTQKEKVVTMYDKHYNSYVAPKRYCLANSDAEDILQKFIDNSSIKKEALVQAALNKISADINPTSETLPNMDLAVLVNKDVLSYMDFYTTKGSQESEIVQILSRGFSLGDYVVNTTGIKTIDESRAAGLDFMNKIKELKTKTIEVK